MKNICLLFFVLIFFACKKEKNQEVDTDPTGVKLDVSATSIIIGDSISFKLDGNIDPSKIEYNWFFKGATPSISTLKNPKVKYKTPGNYDVKLVYKYDNKKDSIIKSKLIKVESTIVEGLIAYYPFNGNANDMTGKGHNGTPKFAVLTTDRFGNENAAYLFNGFNSSILVKDKIDLRLSQTDFTINYWVKLDEFNQSYGSAFLVKRGAGSLNGWGTSITGYASQFNTIKKLGGAFFHVSGGLDPFAVGNNQIELNKWCMITVVYNLKNKTVHLYINGQLDNVTNNIPSPNASTPADMFIGSDNYYVTNSYQVKGKIDDIGFYNRMLSNQEINRIYFNSNTSNLPIFEQ
jgi:PKD repeat protein